MAASVRAVYRFTLFMYTEQTYYETFRLTVGLIIFSSKHQISFNVLSSETRCSHAFAIVLWGRGRLSLRNIGIFKICVLNSVCKIKKALIVLAYMPFGG